MRWILKVYEYGKIESAEIEMAPLTLFVGDNNSGKSYLMSMLWGIQNFGISGLLGREEEEKSREEELLADWIRTQIRAAEEKRNHTIGVAEIADALQSVLDLKISRTKDNFVKRIFNSTDVKIKELKIELKELEKISLTFDISEGKERKWLSVGNHEGAVFSMDYSREGLAELNKPYDWMMISFVFSLVTGIMMEGTGDMSYDVYLPAARTGFMLTKDIINKVGRNRVFNIDTEQEKVTPFVRPINQFLDVMNDLSFDEKGYEKYCKIAMYMENRMAEGTVIKSSLPNGEVIYVPEGQEYGLPLRLVSAVVTELSPLILILKHKRYLNTIFYEEPEMCLHPQLQQKMARVICQLINARLGMVVTTHSDIILQHINNMIRLSGREDSADICRQLGYDSADLLNAGQVRVYQLKSLPEGKTRVEELACGENGFVVPTFNDALDRIMEEAYCIQE